MVGRERFELSTFRLSAERSNHAELPARIAALDVNCMIRIKGFLERGFIIFSGDLNKTYR